MQCRLLCALIVIQITGFKEFSTEEGLDFPGCWCREEPGLDSPPNVPTLTLESLRRLSLALNSGRAPSPAKLEGCACTAEQLGVWAESPRRVRVSDDGKGRDSLGFPSVGARAQQGCGRDCAVCPGIVTGALGALGVRSETFRLNRKLQPNARAGFNKFPYRDAMFFWFYFLASCSECPFRVGYPWFPKKFRDLGPVCVAGSTLCDEVLCRIRASRGRAGELLTGMRAASGACGLGAGQLPAASRCLWTNCGYKWGLRRRNPAAPRPFELPNFECSLSQGWERGLWKCAFLDEFWWTPPDL